MKERRAGGVHAAGTVDAAAGVGGGGGEVETGQSGRGPAAHGRDGAEDQLLVQLGGAAVDGSPDEVGVARFELARPEDAPGGDAGPEAGRERLDAGLHPVGEPLQVVVAPVAADALLAGVAWVAMQLVTADIPQRVLYGVVVVNLLLAVFNLLPGLPLDGGRLVESAVWKATGSQESTKNAR